MPSRVASALTVASVGLFLAASCAPARSPSDASAPSLEAMCAHVADLELRDAGARLPPGSTQATLRRSCEASWKEYEDEGESARWSCHARCRMEATSLAQVNACLDDCQVPLEWLTCDDVFVPAEVAQATGGAAERSPVHASDQYRAVKPGQDNCYTTISTRQSGSETVDDLMLGISVSSTRAAARRRARAQLPCEETLAQGRVTLTATVMGAKSCDRPALQRVLASAATHVDASGAPVANPAGTPVKPALDARAGTSPAPHRPPPVCPGQPEVQPVFAPVPVVRGRSPSVEQMCAHVAEVEAAGAPPDVWSPGTTKASVRKECRDYWTQYRDEESADLWACQSRCRTGAGTYAQLERCDATCAPQVNPFHCDCVVREEDVSLALGLKATLTASRSNEVTPSKPECTAYLHVEGAVERMHVSLYIHDTKAVAKSQESGAPMGMDCEVFGARGHVFYIVDGKDAGQCDKAALMRVLERVSSRVGG